MLSFRRFLREAFLQGVDSRYGYAEVFKNPSLSEMREVAGGPSKELGAWVTPEDLYIWNRGEGDHMTILRQVGPIRKSRNLIPVYINYDRGTQTAKLAVASFSASGDAAHMSLAQVVEYCKAHPAFGIFKNVRAR